MSAPTQEIILSDVLAWEPRLAWLGQPPGWRDREVSWASAARASAPMLAPLRGGEIVLLPPPAVTWSGASLATLLRDLAPLRPAAVVIAPPRESAFAAAGDLPLLTLPGVDPTAELESALNRLLAERRGELYRAGTELGHALTALAGRDPDAADVARVAAEAIGLPLTVFDRTDHLLARTPAPRAPAAPPATECVVRALGDGGRLVVGPVAPDRHALARLVAERIAAALNEVLRRAADRRPRGPARAEAVADLIAGRQGRSRAEIEAQARQIGLPVDAVYRVALIAGAPATPPDWLRRAGTVHDAGMTAGATACLVECRDRDGALGSEPDRGASSLTAVSAPAFGAAAVSEAGRQAAYIWRLLNSGSLRGPVVRFDRPDELRAYRLLYHLWGSPTAERYAQETLAGLRRRDRRGELRQTLRAVLAARGSQVEAARRLGIHRNTLAYRLRQIDGALGQDLSDADVAFGLRLALLIDDLPPLADDRSGRRDAANGRPDLDGLAYDR